MKVLVINAGSSSVKYQLLDMKDESVLAKGLCERIGMAGNIKHSTADGRTYAADIDMPTHKEALTVLFQTLTTGDAKVIDNVSEITAVGHRIVQGGAIFDRSVLVEGDVLDKIDSLCPLAPLHNPGHVIGIKACLDVLGPDVPEAVVFDTSFHQTMPPKAFLYGVPYDLYEKYSARRYGFHGTSHSYVSKRLVDLLGRSADGLKIITCHLGNGGSIAAVENGLCVDTSMGFTPLDGFLMGTRSGSVDPSLITFLGEKEGLTWNEMSELLNKKSGVLGISGVSNDNRDVRQAATDGNDRARLALEMQVYQIAKIIGSYVAAMNGVDHIIFTAGMGENDSTLRSDICAYLGYLGVRLDAAANSTQGQELRISTDESAVGVYVVPTNEELVIARDTMTLLRDRG